MLIQTEETPNPNALKFFPGSNVSSAGPIFFKTLEETLHKSQLASKIFNIGNVSAVFYASNFITVTKTDNVKWKILKPKILVVIMDHLTAGLPVFDDIQSILKDIDTDKMSDVEKQIVKIIETRVRPSVAMDGGDIVYQGFENGIVYLQLRGACSGCPSSSITLKNGIESMLQHFVPGVKAVEAVEK